MQSELQGGKVDEASELLRQVIPDTRWAAGVQEEAASEEAMLRVLASVGTQMSTVVHEMGGLATATADLVKTVRRLRSEKSLPKGALGRLERSLRDLQHSVERQAAYLVDIVSAEARRRRSKQRLAERFDAASRIIELVARQRELTIVNDIPKNARTPPMFPAELTSVFSNLLTNAVKAAGDGGVIRASGGRRGDEVVVRVENTGTAVDLSEADRWFEAFESSTAEIHPVLGQGMGLGLTIVQRILEEYRASIAFVEPSPDFATAVEMRFPA
jgi:signal transduction histidine kinase